MRARDNHLNKIYTKLLVNIYIVDVFSYICTFRDAHVLFLLSRGPDDFLKLLLLHERIYDIVVVCCSHVIYLYVVVIRFVLFFSYLFFSCACVFVYDAIYISLVRSCFTGRPAVRASERTRPTGRLARVAVGARGLLV